MNKGAILYLAEVITANPDKFNMNWFGYDHDSGTAVTDSEELLHNCGTTACIGGWANAIDGWEFLEDEAHAREVLGLTFGQSQALFWGYPILWGMENALTNATAEDGARVLRSIADGTATWPDFSVE